MFTGLVGAYISLAIMTLLLLVGLSSDLCDAFDCRMGRGGYLAILDSILWMIAACLAFKMKGDMESSAGEEDYDDDKGDEKPLPALPPSENNALSNKV